MIESAIAREPYGDRWDGEALAPRHVAHRREDFWDLHDLDVMDPAHLTLEPKGHGTLGLLAIEGDLDYRVVQREGLPAIEFSFEGSDEGDRISGRGWAVLDGEQLRGTSSFIRATTLDLRPPV